MSIKRNTLKGTSGWMKQGDLFSDYIFTGASVVFGCRVAQFRVCLLSWKEKMKKTRFSFLATLTHREREKPFFRTGELFRPTHLEKRERYFFGVVERHMNQQWTFRVTFPGLVFSPSPPPTHLLTTTTQKTLGSIKRDEGFLLFKRRRRT